MLKYRLAQASAVLNLLGALLVFLSFQATSTNLLLITSADQQLAAFCVGGRAAFLMRGPAVGLGVTCPTGPNIKPTAIVNTDSPFLEYIGWGLLGLGFFTQLFSLEKPNLTADDLRILRKARKIIEGFD
jgi:hypothetical protein